MAPALPADVDAVAALLERHDYFADRRLATSVFLALRMRRPLFLEGEAGVGKTEIGKVLASALGRALVRLQCYEGLDTASAVYEWNYPRQMIEIRLAEASGNVDRQLIDELDRTDEPFEAYLLEVLAEYQVTIPELGTIKAAEPPIVVITSNRTREIHDAIKRRCLYHWVDYPNAERELAIVRRKVPGVDARLSREVVAFTQRLRELDLFKAPDIAETLNGSFERLLARYREVQATMPELAPKPKKRDYRRRKGARPGPKRAAK